MRNGGSFALLALLALGCDAREQRSPATVAALPADVVQFQKRRDACDHFRGEEGYDEERQRFLHRQLEATCTGTDEELARLKRVYAGDARVLVALNDYEEKVE